MILVAGDASWDFLFEIDRFPGPDEKVFTDTMLTNVGGVGANAAVAAHLLGAEVCFLGRFGGDALAAGVERGLAAAGLDLSYCRRDPHLATPIAIIMTDPSGEKRIVLAPSPAMSPVPEQLPTTLPTDLQWAHMVAYDLDAAVSIASGLGQTPMSLDMEPATVPGGDPKAMRRLLEQMDTVILNSHACELFGGRDEAVRTLARWGVPVVVTTLGAEGAVCNAGGEELPFPAPRVEVVDTTGAGDAFAAAYSVARAEGFLPAEAVRFAVCAATLSCRGLGPRGAFPTRTEIDSLIGDV